MIEFSVSMLFGILVSLILLSAFFSASETAMMALNRYRLRHLAETGHRGARVASRLLARPDRLLGVILLGNNLVNFSASATAGIIALELYGEWAIAWAAIPLTIIVLIFAEVGPKTLAALHPERIAYPAAFILLPLLKVGYPAIWLINLFANMMLRLFGVPLRHHGDHLSTEELRSVVRETGNMIPASHQAMLLGILDLEKIKVEDIMVPRSAIEGIDLDAGWDDILTQLATSHHTRLPVFEGTLDNIVGVLHLRKVLHLSQRAEFSKETLRSIMREPYFIPEGTAVTQQLLNMQAEKRRFGLVVDEYGDIKGLVTLEEILEEIVGEFTTQAPGTAEDILLQEDGSYRISGTAAVRDINRKLDWDLPTDGPKTLNGLILEYLEHIPEAGTSLMLTGHPVEILQTRGAAVRLAKVMPRVLTEETTEES